MGTRASVVPKWRAGFRSWGRWVWGEVGGGVGALGRGTKDAATGEELRARRAGGRMERPFRSS